MVHVPGIADEEFIRGNRPMTKQEVRILTLVKAAIADGDIIIDVGAGTGSLSIEAALLAPRGKIFAIEREAEGIKLIQANIEKFAITNIMPIFGEAPQAMENLPGVDVVMIGGSGGNLGDIISCSDRLLKPGGRLVLNAVTVETLHNVLQLMRNMREYRVEACGVQVNRIHFVGSSSMFQALNPVYIIACHKEKR